MNVPQERVTQVHKMPFYLGALCLILAYTHAKKIRDPMNFFCGEHNCYDLLEGKTLRPRPSFHLL